MNKPRPPIHPEDINTQSRVSLLAKYSPYREIRKHLTIVNSYPRFLYTYISSDIKDEWLRSILIDSDLYLSSPQDFNDPFDTSANVIYTGTPQKNRLRYKQLIKDRMPGISRAQRREKLLEFERRGVSPEVIKETFLRHTQGVGLACFTEDPRNILMWSHYAKKHSGIVLQFELARDPESLLFALKMHYSDDYPSYDFHKDLQDQFEPILLRKALLWKYEMEWRILRIGGARTYQAFKPSALTGLIFGCKATTAYKKYIHMLLNERQSLHNTPLNLYQAIKHQSKFKLRITSCLNLQF